MDDADCGINPVTGDKMGQGYSGLCMHPGCYKVVDHGQSHACGGDHGGGDIGCGKYFCDDHLYLIISVCDKCYRKMVESATPWDDLFDPPVLQFPVEKTVLTTFYNAGQHVPLPFPDDDDSSDP